MAAHKATGPASPVQNSSQHGLCLRGISACHRVSRIRNILHVFDACTVAVGAVSTPVPRDRSVHHRHRHDGQLDTVWSECRRVALRSRALRVRNYACMRTHSCYTNQATCMSARCNLSSGCRWSVEPTNICACVDC